MRSDGLILLLLFVYDLGRKGVGIALFDALDCLQTLRLVLSVICAVKAFTSAAQVPRGKALAVELEAPRLLA
jgi:hypothetical protein